MSDPERMMDELYDAQDKVRLGIGEYEKFYDPAAGIQTTAREIKKIYGGRLLKRWRNELEESKNKQVKRPEGFISPELLGVMKDIRKSQGLHIKSSKPEQERDYVEDAPISKPIPIAKAKPSKIKKYKEPTEAEETIQRERQPGDDYFMRLERGLFLNPEFRKLFKSPFTVYGWLWSHIARTGWIDKKGYPLKKNYYDKGYLAYSSSLSQIGKDCFLDKDTVRSYIIELYRKKIIKLNKLIPEGKKRGQYVYILGEWKSVNGKPKETSYLNQVMLSAKEDELW